MEKGMMEGWSWKREGGSGETEKEKEGGGVEGVVERWGGTGRGELLDGRMQDIWRGEDVEKRGGWLVDGGEW